jgi:hypothetical protein
MAKKPSSDELAAQLAAMKADLEDAQKELARSYLEKEKPKGMDAFINAVSKVTLPTFWESDPVLWFRQCESAFRRHGTAISSGVKFDHVVGKLPNAVSLSCRSLLLDINFEDADAYERLKAHLCKNFGKSKWQMVSHSLTVLASAIAAHPSFCKTCEPCFRQTKPREHFFSAYS